jgi:hypothetical protein
VSNSRFSGATFSDQVSVVSTVSYKGAFKRKAPRYAEPHERFYKIVPHLKSYIIIIIHLALSRIYVNTTAREQIWSGAAQHTWILGNKFIEEEFPETFRMLQHFFFCIFMILFL